MTQIRSTTVFWQGAVAALPFLVVLMPFSLLFGVMATESGLDLAQVMGFSVLVIAGASQFTAVQLMTDQAPAVIVLISALAVNLRMAMYSAALQPHLGEAGLGRRALIAYFLVDQSYALAIARYERTPPLTLPQRLAYYFGTMVVTAPAWYALTLAGALLGRTIPEDYALDFALPVTFIALIAPALRSLAHVAAAGVSVVLGLALAGLPYNAGLLVAAGAAMLTGALIEQQMQRGRP